MWSVTRIDEADYGCEERMPGEPLLVLVTIESDDGRMCRFVRRTGSCNRA